jgi:hypothetical protein
VKLAMNVQTWAKWFESADRVVKKTTLNGVRVSTVFLGIDHGLGRGPRELFETMGLRRDARSAPVAGRERRRPPGNPRERLGQDVP